MPLRDHSIHVPASWVTERELSRSFREHHRDLIICRIDDHDIILDDDVAEGRNLWNVRYHGVREGKQRDAARNFAGAKTDAQLRSRTVFVYAGID